MAYPISDNAANWLRTAHSAAAFLRVTNTASIYPGPATEDIPLNAGSVDMDGGALIRSTGTFTLPPDTWDRAQLWPLYGARLQPFYSIGSVDLVQPGELVPFAPMICETASRAQPGADVELSGSDLMRLVEYADLDSDVPAAGWSSRDLLAWLVSPSGLPADANNSFASNPSVGASFVLEQSNGRMKYVRDLADSFTNDIWMTRVGTWLSVPKARPLEVAWRIDAGASGVLLGGSDKLTAERTRNSVVVFSEATDGRPPIWVRAEDSDPNSPTYVNGPFGRRTYRRDSGFLRDASSMLALANALLETGTKLARDSSFDIAPAPQLDPGDLVTVRFPRETDRECQIVTIKHDLGGGAASVSVADSVGVGTLTARRLANAGP
jgi:hypothetical protein